MDIVGTREVSQAHGDGGEELPPVGGGIRRARVSRKVTKKKGWLFGIPDGELTSNKEVAQLGLAVSAVALGPVGALPVKM